MVGIAALGWAMAANGGGPQFPLESFHLAVPTLM
jgi:hypothetical protein